MALKRTDYIWMDSKFLSWDEATTNVMDYSLHYGASVFEGIKAYAMSDGRVAVFRLGDHISRLFDSASVLRIPVLYTKGELEKAVVDTILKNNVAYNCYIRPMIWFGHGDLGLLPVDTIPRAMVAVFSWNQRNLKTAGIKVKISSVHKPHHNSLPTHAKISGCYLPSILARIEANENGFDDAILLDYRGYVAEGTGANIFMVNNGTIATPRPEHILLGITRDSLITIARNMGYTVQERDLTVEDLQTSDELFFSGTAAEITPIIEVNGKKIGNRSIGNVTSEIRREYFRLLNGDNAKYTHWLKFVDTRSFTKDNNPRVD